MKMRRRTKIISWVGGVVATLIVLGAVLWIRTFHDYTPVDFAKDLRAAAQVRAEEHAGNAPHPAERFLELRYGSLAEPANRQRAFLDFFNVGHVEGLKIITSLTRSAEQQTNTAAMAQWIANYRRTMSPEEKRALSTYFQSAAGRKAAEEATAKTLSESIQYREANAPVIMELTITVLTLQKP
jgi:hypothetical protein